MKLELDVLSWRGDFCKAGKGKANVDGQLAVEATLMCKMVDREPQPSGRNPRNTARENSSASHCGGGASLAKGVKIVRTRCWRRGGIGRRLRAARACVVQGPSKFGKSNVFHGSVCGGDPRTIRFAGTRGAGAEMEIFSGNT